MKRVTFIFLFAIILNSMYSSDFLLKKTFEGEKKEIIWGQHRNNDNNSTNKDAGCSPSYNKFSPNNSNKEECKKDPTGCAAIAIGQIMAMWQYPNKSK